MQNICSSVEVQRKVEVTEFVTKINGGLVNLCKPWFMNKFYNRYAEILGFDNVRLKFGHIKHIIRVMTSGVVTINLVVKSPKYLLFYLLICS